MECWCWAAVADFVERVVIDQCSLKGIFGQLNSVIEASLTIAEVRELKAKAMKEEEAGYTMFNNQAWHDALAKLTAQG